MRYKILDKILPQNRILYSAEKVADEVLSLEKEYSQYSLEELKNQTNKYIEFLANGGIIDEVLHILFAIIRETIFKITGLKAYKCQIIGAVIVHYGDFSEMMTGEGKTLTLVLAAFVNALYKKGVHIVTVNEYLVERDATFANDILRHLGLTCGYVVASMDEHQKRINYNYDITYVSNSELGFDYLRDNMVKNIEDKVQRGLFFAIVDEADSILIDEARTPLIIAGQPNEDVTNYIRVDKFIKTLNEEDYIIDLESHVASLSEFGVEKAQKEFKIENIYDVEFSDLIHKITNSLRANFIMNNGVEYIVRNNPNTHQPEIALIDAFTGRILEGRTYNAGLHQAIQAKEMVSIDPENITVATITYQSLFRLYKKLSGVSGTAYTESEELLNIYNMVVVPVPTNKPIIRIDQPDYIFETKKIKWKYVVAEIKKRHKTGQPILIGTASVEDSEILHLLLTRIGIKHTVLNAKNHAQEAEIIKNAGQIGNITIATYMAGRGTDIKLGEGVRELGGLYVIGTERNESRRIDNQLRGRSGRQGDPGESRFFISLQDNLFKRFAGDRFNKANDKISEDVIDTRFFSRLLDNTQKRIEGLNYDSRKSLIDYDYVLSSQRELFYKQRDNVLIIKNLKHIILRMYIYIINSIIKNNLDEINKDIVNIINLVDEFNNNIFFETFLTVSDIKEIKVSYLFKYLYIKCEEFLNKREEEITEPFFNDLARKVILNSMDQEWAKHLEKVFKTRESVNLRAYEQRSPLNIYVNDVDIFFKELIYNVAFQSIVGINKKEINNNDIYSPELDFLKNNQFYLDDINLDEKLYSQDKKEFVLRMSRTKSSNDFNLDDLYDPLVIFDNGKSYV